MRAAVATVAPFLVATQATNLALLVSAILARRTLCLSELARAYPRPVQRRVARPKHDLLHCLKRLWRFLDNGRIDAVAVQAALVPEVVARLGQPRRLGLAIDWTMFDTHLPSGRRARYQVLRIAIPRRGRALPLLQVAYDRDRLPAGRSQNQLEEGALDVVLRALPPGVRGVVLADRGFARATFLAWLHAHPTGPDFVVRVDKGTCLTEPDGRRWKLGTEGLALTQLRWAPGVCYTLHHGRPRDLVVNVALCWRASARRASRRRHRVPAEPWYLATSLDRAEQAVAWYWQRGWIEQAFKDSKSRFGLKHVRIGCPARLSRLLAAFTFALAWLTLAALPELGALPARWTTRVAHWGHASLISLALALLDYLHDLPLVCLPPPARSGGYA
ncbi:MAG TPA: transposase [Acidimicrobiales bacterium]